jgi:hypothetical protein
MNQNGYRQAALLHLQLSVRCRRICDRVGRCKIRGYRGRRRPEMAERPWFERRQHCRTNRLLAGNGHPGLCEIPRNVRARRRHSARCRTERRQAGGGSSIGNIPQEPGPIAW